MTFEDDMKGLVGDKFVNSVKYAGDIFGSLNTGYQMLEAGEGVLKWLGVLNDGPNPMLLELQKMLEPIQKGLDDILKALEDVRKESVNATGGIERSTICNDASDVRTAAYDGYWYLKLPSPDNESQFHEMRDKAESSINHFKDNPYYWRRIYLDFLDYNDIWSGSIHPPTEEGGIWVWDFIVTLPAYLEALASWCAVILASDAGFQQAHFFQGPEILEHINKLHEALAKILSGFQLIRAPNKDEMVYVMCEADDQNFYESVYTFPDAEHEGGSYTNVPMTEAQINQALNFLPGGKWRLSGYLYGVVEDYIGLTCSSAYPILEVGEGANYLDGSYVNPLLTDHNPTDATKIISQPEEYQKFYDRFVLRHSLRSWKQAKVMSQTLGLPNVRNSICHLCAIRNIQPPELPPEYNKYVVSSLREIRSIVPDSLRDAQNQGKPLGMRELGGILGIQSPISLRRIFFLDE